MPDFAALAKLLGGIKDLISGITGGIGSVEGNGVKNVLGFFDTASK